MKRLDILMRAGGVERWHTNSEVKFQTVAEHSWGVAAIFMELFPEHVNVNTLHHIMLHDVGELFTGDIPATAKWQHTEFKDQLELVELVHLTENSILSPEINSHEAKAIKVCDYIEMLYHCARFARRTPELDAGLEEVFKVICENAPYENKAVYIAQELIKRYGGNSI